VEQLEQAPEEELWVIADCSDLRKPYAEAMPFQQSGPRFYESNPKKCNRRWRP